ncbi:MAG TPA: response regulator [Terriglobales bacterium]|jgi:CheY-like chemotaxis protein|nr:response regulator [Terriglobales bacterium]
MPPQKTTILIVDDEPLHLKLYSWILEAQGYDCKTALVSRDSVDWPSDAHIDLALLDYRLSSSLTAIEVAGMLKDKFPSVPIVVLSELFGMPHDMGEHAIAFVNKGNPQHLVDTVKSITQAKLL